MDKLIFWCSLYIINSKEKNEKDSTKSSIIFIIFLIFVGCANPKPREADRRVMRNFKSLVMRKRILSLETNLKYVKQGKISIMGITTIIVQRHVVPIYIL